VTSLFLKVLARKKRAAFARWAVGVGSSSTSAISLGKTSTTLADVLLSQASGKRVQLQGELRDAATTIALIRQSIASVSLSKDVRNKMQGSMDFKATEEGMDPYKVVGRGMLYLYEGDGYTRELKYERAQSMYEAQILWLRDRPRLDIKMLSICHGRLGKMFLLTGKTNRAIVEFDRQLSLAREIHDRVEETEVLCTIPSRKRALYVLHGIL
jgi:hypothetical protein